MLVIRTDIKPFNESTNNSPGKLNLFNRVVVPNKPSYTLGKPSNKLLAAIKPNALSECLANELIMLDLEPKAYLANG